MDSTHVIPPLMRPPHAIPSSHATPSRCYTFTVCEAHAGLLLK